MRELAKFVWYTIIDMFRNSEYFLIGNDHHYIGIRFLNRTNRSGGFTFVPPAGQFTEEVVIWKST